MNVEPLQCAGGCELGLAICEGQWVAQMCVLQRRDPAYRTFLIEQSRAGLAIRPPPPGSAPIPLEPIISEEWAALALRGELCQYRTLIAEGGCCGPRHYCIGGRHPGELAEPISVCAECMRAFDAASS